MRIGDVSLFQEKLAQIIKKQLWDFIKLKNLDDNKEVIERKFSPFISFYPQAYQDINDFLRLISVEGINTAEEKLESDLKKPKLDKQLKKRTDFIVISIDKILIKWLSDLIRQGRLSKISTIELMKYLTEKFEETAIEKSQIIVKAEILTMLNLAEYETYSLNGVKQFSWKTAVGEENQEECFKNEAVGYINLGSGFPSGHLCPPNGLYCSCFLMPN